MFSQGWLGPPLPQTSLGTPQHTPKDHQQSSLVTVWLSVGLCESVGWNWILTFKDGLKLLGSCDAPLPVSSPFSTSHFLTLMCLSCPLLLSVLLCIARTHTISLYVSISLSLSSSLSFSLPFSFLFLSLSLSIHLSLALPCSLSL